VEQLAVVAGHADHALLVAASPVGLLGWLQISVRRMFETPATAEIAAIVVDEDLRGGGIGRLLVASAEAWAQGRGCRTVRVRSNVLSERAHQFYERQGYERVKVQQVFDKALSPRE
jgi:GNAT superfamily N-acetyltransferase